MDSQVEPCPCSIPSDCVPIPSNPAPIPLNCVPIPSDSVPIPLDPAPIPLDCIPIPSNPAPIPPDPTPIPPDPSPSLSAGSGIPPGADPVKIADPGAEPFTIETPGMCVMKFPLQNSIVAVELCPPGTGPEPFPPPPEEINDPKTCPEILGELPRETPTLEVVELGVEEPCRAPGAIPGDPCGSRSGNCTDPLRSRGFGEPGEPKDSRSQTFRLNSCTSSIVERCLARCQGWFRGKN